MCKSARFDHGSSLNVAFSFGVFLWGCFFMAIAAYLSSLHDRKVVSPPSTKPANRDKLQQQVAESQAEVQERRRRRKQNMSSSSSAAGAAGQGVGDSLNRSFWSSTAAATASFSDSLATDFGHMGLLGQGYAQGLLVTSPTRMGK